MITKLEKKAKIGASFKLHTSIFSLHAEKCVEECAEPCAEKCVEHWEIEKYE